MRLFIWRTWCYVEAQYMRLAISWCYFEAQVWKKDSNIVPFYFFPFFGSSLFLFGLSLFFLGQWSINDDPHTSIYLQLNDYNSIVEQNMTLYECLRRCTGMGNESRVTCMINYAWWLCHKYDVNYMIMQSNMTMMKRVIINETVESCMAIYLGMAMEMP